MDFGRRRRLAWQTIRAFCSSQWIHSAVKFDAFAAWCSQVQPLHRQHTAQVLTLCTPDTTRVLSGGADKRVVLHTLGAPGGAGATVGRLLLDGRVNRIICRGETLLVSTCTAREQVCLFDARSVGMGGGGKEKAALRFVRLLARPETCS